MAEDDADQLFVRSMLLRQNGFEAIEAADIDSAMQKAFLHKPECAIIDLRLPTEEAGLEADTGAKEISTRRFTSSY